MADAGWAGWDPYDVRSHPLYLAVARRARTSRLHRLPLGVLYRFEQRFPLHARRWFRARPTINAKGMGLFARAFDHLDDHAEASRRIEWLLGNTAAGTAGIGWGYPFDWQSDVLIPRGTPSSVVTCTVADALRARADGSEMREVLLGIGRFLAEDLSRTPSRTGNGHCFSYTPIDRFCIHNANVMSAEFLLWAGRRFDRPEWIELARGALAYTLDDQSADGTWDYWGPEHERRPPRHVDAYHTGFILRMLLRAHDLTGDPEYRTAALRGYEAFTHQLFDGGRPRHTVERPFPVNIHAVAEGILAHQAFRDLDPAALTRAHDVFEWGVRHMFDDAGFFHYLWTPGYRNRLPMMRWGQAWMLLALAALSSSERNL